MLINMLSQKGGSARVDHGFDTTNKSERETLLSCSSSIQVVESLSIS